MTYVAQKRLCLSSPISSVKRVVLTFVLRYSEAVNVDKLSSLMWCRDVKRGLTTDARYTDDDDDDDADALRKTDDY